MLTCMAFAISRYAWSAGSDSRGTRLDVTKDRKAANVSP